MNLRQKLSLTVSLLLTGGVVYAQQTAPAPPAPPTPPAQGLYGNAISLFIDGNSFLGVYTEDIDKEKASRYGLREARGVGITKIVAGSPAEKAGLRKDDVILRFDNDAVTSVRKLNRLVSEVAPDQTVRLVISRGGSEQEVVVTIGERKDHAETLKGLLKTPRAGVWSTDGSEPFVFAFGNNRRIGVSTMQLTKQLAEYFGITDGKGVLVTSVADDSPAAKAGIKAGDIIVAADGEKIEGSGDLSRAINKKKDGDVTLTVIHNKSQRNVTVTPKEGGPMIAPGQIGRRVIVPRIELPDIPEMNIRIPRIELPSIPQVDVEFPQGSGRVRRPQRPI
jgi:membrane-associated protease RseP (regulator of RpoE activity)